MTVRSRKGEGRGGIRWMPRHPHAGPFQRRTGKARRSVRWAPLSANRRGQCVSPRWSDFSLTAGPYWKSIANWHPSPTP